jgi:phosphonate transport system substrate-binding protein
MLRTSAAGLAAALTVGTMLAIGSVQPSRAADCPNGGTVRVGVEPFETAGKLQPLYDSIGKLLSTKLGCDVVVYVASNYNAEIEAMRAGKLEIGEFGPLGYILAHQIAGAEAVATFATVDGKKPAVYFASIVTTPGSGITNIKQVTGHSFAYSDPASTSGHLFPAYALRKNGIDPDTGVKGVYAGSHTASFEAIRNKKVDAGEMNSQVIDSMTASSQYHESDFVTLWKSDPIPTDPIAVRKDLPDSFKARVREAFVSMDLTSIDTNNILKGFGHKFVPVQDSIYQPIRDLVATLHIDLTKM